MYGTRLPEEVVEAGTIPTLKKLLARCMDRTGLEGYGPNAGRWAKLGRRACFHTASLYDSTGLSVNWLGINVNCDLRVCRIVLMCGDRWPARTGWAEGPDSVLYL